MAKHEHPLLFWRTLPCQGASRESGEHAFRSRSQPTERFSSSDFGDGSLNRGSSLPKVVSSLTVFHLGEKSIFTSYLFVQKTQPSSYLFNGYLGLFTLGLGSVGLLEAQPAFPGLWPPHPHWKMQERLPCSYTHLNPTITMAESCYYGERFGNLCKANSFRVT